MKMKGNNYFFSTAKIVDYIHYNFIVSYGVPQGSEFGPVLNIL